MKYFIPLFIALNASVANAQTSLELNYSDVNIGRNLNLCWKQTISDFSVSAGLTYHLNRIDKIPLGSLVRKNAFAENFGQHFGIQLGFDYFLYENEHLKLGVFYNNQSALISHVFKSNSIYVPLVPEPQSEFDYAYIKEESIWGPFITSDNVIGLTMKNTLTRNFYLTSKAGLGMLFWKNTDDSVSIFAGSKVNQGYSFTGHLSVGLGYTFNKKMEI